MPVKHNGQRRTRWPFVSNRLCRDGAFTCPRSAPPPLPPAAPQLSAQAGPAATFLLRDTTVSRAGSAPGTKVQFRARRENFLCYNFLQPPTPGNRMVKRQLVRSGRPRSFTELCHRRKISSVWPAPSPRSQPWRSPLVARVFSPTQSSAPLPLFPKLRVLARVQPNR